MELFSLVFYFAVVAAFWQTMSSAVSAGLKAAREAPPVMGAQLRAGLLASLAAVVAKLDALVTQIMLHVRASVLVGGLLVAACVVQIASPRATLGAAIMLWVWVAIVVPMAVARLGAVFRTADAKSSQKRDNA